MGGDNIHTGLKTDPEIDIKTIANRAQVHQTAVSSSPDEHPGQANQIVTRFG